MDRNWVGRAACSGLDPAIFYPPTDEEADPRAHGLTGIGVRRPSGREDLRHPSVADRREEHDDQGHQIRQRHHAIGFLRHDPERVEQNRGGHVSQAQADDRPKTEGPIQSALICQRAFPSE